MPGQDPNLVGLLLKWLRLLREMVLMIDVTGGVLPDILELSSLRI